MVTICFGLMIWYSVDAALAGYPLTPITDASFLWLIVNELTLAAVALLVLRARGFAIASLYPAPSVVGTLHGMGLFFLAWLAMALALAPFAGVPQPIDRMISEAKLSVAVIGLVAVVNAPFEEVFLLGFLVRGLQGFGVNTAMAVSLLVRVLCHLYQGPVGAMAVLVFGTVITLSFVISGKLWPAVFCHMLWDVVPFLWPHA